MAEVLDGLVKELSEIYDEDSKNSFISLYKEKDSSMKYFEKRQKACKMVLTTEEKEYFSKTLDEINSFFKKNTHFQGAIFASKKYSYFKAIPLDIRITNTFIVDSSPYIRLLARILDEWESFTLLLLNSNYSKIYSISLGRVIDKKTLSSDIMNKHKKGGWSQARFQRLRKGAIQSFFSEVEKALNKIADKQIVLAGPGQAKLHFRDYISPKLEKKIIATIDISIDDEKELLKESINIVSDLEKNKSHDATKQLKEEILKDGLAAYGIQDTLKAVKNGQVELLIVEKNYKKKGFICEKCQVLKVGSIKKCPSCGGIVSEVDVIEEIIEFGNRTDVRIEFTDDEEISNLGHVGAILRYK
jgi:peptide chain release factor subunit 1